MSNFQWKHDRRLQDLLPSDPCTELKPRQVLNASFSQVAPTHFGAEPTLVIRSWEMADLLNAPVDAELLPIVSGQLIPGGVEPYAMCYGGHQFGHWAGQLGDGRAIVLGEVLDRCGNTQTLQLKGAGMTPYSRGADGRAVLRSSVREFLCSEGMHHLGIPTTRALSLVLTNDGVMRDMLYDGNPAVEPGAIVCRVAPSFLRFGSLELPNARGNRGLVGQTIDYLLDHHYPMIESRGSEGAYRLLETIADKTARLIVDWMRVGFVHGVLNTDNMSLHGLTIDYGPYGWLEEFDLNWTPNTTDAQGRRYAYGRQPDIGLWNVTRLGESMYGVLDDVDRLKAAVGVYKTTFESEYPLMLRSKLGLGNDIDVADEQLVGMIGQVLSDGRFDMTNFYAHLGSWICRDGASKSSDVLKHFETASYASSFDADAAALLTYWVRLYDERHLRCGGLNAQRRAEMAQVNPQFVLRNYLVQKAIESAELGDYAPIADLLESARTPYTRRADKPHHYAMMPDWARNKAGCSMLSCSS